jgi:hypothetical protein
VLCEPGVLHGLLGGDALRGVPPWGERGAGGGKGALGE